MFRAIEFSSLYTTVPQRAQGCPRVQMIEISASSFDNEVAGSDKPVVLEFWVRSCRQCQKFKPVYEKLSEVFGDKMKFLKMNMLKSIENLRMAESFGVEATPTTKLFCGDRVVGEIVGYRTLEEAVREIEEILDREDYCGGPQESEPRESF